MSSGLQKSAKKYPNYIRIVIEAEPKFPSEWWKTGIAIVYALFNLFLIAVMITVVHERVPPKETSPPLPDKLFPYIDRVKLAFYVTEINGMVLVGIWFMQWMLLRYKSIVCRRYCFIIGTLYLYRCITMYVTTLPVPGMYFECDPKLPGDFYGKAQRILTLISGGGLTIAGSHALCGDFLYSGHTVILTLTYLFIKEYSPRQFWWYQLVCWLLSASGVICILVARVHYTVAVIVAYYITTRLFWWYHAMANEKDSSQWNFLSRASWFPVFYFFEKNIKDRLPCSFSWPISLPPSCFKTLCKKNSRVQKMREDIANIT